MKWLLITFLAIIATAESRRCEPRTIFFEYCNTCWCSADGKDAECTKVVCASGGWNKDGTLKKLTEQPKLDLKAPIVQNSDQVCRPYSIFKEYCDRCTCSGDGKTAVCSTEIGCDPTIWNEDGTLKFGLRPGQVCTPNFGFTDQCNSCVCAPNGKTASCTKLMDCLPRVWVKTKLKETENP